MKNFIVYCMIGIAMLGSVSCKTKSKTQSSQEGQARSAHATSKKNPKSANDSVTVVNEIGSSVATRTNPPVVYQGVTDQACALEMAFGSYGSGIDGGAFDKATTLINTKKLKYTSKNIGREGETRLCLPLTELNKKEKDDLVKQLKKIALEGQLVSLSIR